ncbi:hypothetical protein DPEC_G00203050 [Dallia pectoralis]|uniref:Uncharacterized protein n=1 Tax=Dallia pectoralis TaxID=75939 RepID=A0ACC2G9X0_DALPE|nr:hypothetical protein DPEC_G00203050 [Dallia pectoralis]
MGKYHDATTESLVTVGSRFPSDRLTLVVPAGPDDIRSHACPRSTCRPASSPEPEHAKEQTQWAFCPNRVTDYTPAIIKCADDTTTVVCVGNITGYLWGIPQVGGRRHDGVKLIRTS